MESNINVNTENKGVSRRSRNKKNSKQLTNETSTAELLTEPLQSESVDTSNATNDNTSEVNVDGIVSKEILSPLDESSNRVSRDVSVYAEPQYEIAELQKMEGRKRRFSYNETEVVDGAPMDKTQKLLPLNTRALSKYATTYKLETFEKKALIIFNQENFDMPKKKKRLGTQKDVQALTKTFKKFGFEVFPHNDLTKEQVFNELTTFSERNFTDYGCVAVAVLTHGSKNGLLSARDEEYSEIEIINHFIVLNKPTLVTKPKIIIIQACRGGKKVPGAHVSCEERVWKDMDDDTEPYLLPVEADLLILHSSYSGTPSHRDIVDGTWFIQELCRKIDSLSPTQDLESIITEVKRTVATNKEHKEYNKKTNKWEVGLKQMPVTTSTLIRKLYLRKFVGEPMNVEADTERGSACCESRQEVLDSATSHTPLLVQFGPCFCFLKHFTYMRNSLRHFVEDNPRDGTARYILEAADAFEELTEFNMAKERMCKAISKYLFDNAQSYGFHKYLYFYKH